MPGEATETVPATEQELPQPQAETGRCPLALLFVKTEPRAIWWVQVTNTFLPLEFADFLNNFFLMEL